MAKLVERFNEYLIPAALGAMIYFLQSMAHDSNELAKTVAVMARHQDDFEATQAMRQAEYERRIQYLESQSRTARSGSR
jgi:hypothetical protein